MIADKVSMIPLSIGAFVTISKVPGVYGGSVKSNHSTIFPEPKTTEINSSTAAGVPAFAYQDNVF